HAILSASDPPDSNAKLTVVVQSSTTKHEQSLPKTTTFRLTIVKGELKSNESPGADHIFIAGIQGSGCEAIL
nr:hypothetical protein [Tanacetum cinerariifolium]